MYKPSKQEMANYLEGLVRLAPYYVWGMDMDIINDAAIKALKKKFGESKYEGKLLETKTGYFGSDCSGMLTKILGTDKTAQAYYNLCKENATPTSKLSSVPSYALVFKGTPENIVHVGVLLDGYTYEMYNRCDKKPFDRSYWHHVGQLDFMQAYNAENATQSSGMVQVMSAVKGYLTADDAKAGKNPKTTLNPGTYHIYKQVGDNCFNLTKSKGVPGAWIVI